MSASKYLWCESSVTGPRTAGLLWALATWMKWIPVIVWPILGSGAKRWGLLWLAVSIALVIVSIPMPADEAMPLSRLT